MSEKNNTPFKSAKLQKAVNSVTPQVRQLTESLDTVSSDIKLLESYLQSSPIREPVSIELPTFWVSAGEDPEDYQGPATKIVRTLSWEPERVGTWRLMYKESRWVGSIEVHGGDLIEEEWPDVTVLTNRPLIEAPIGDRVEAYVALPRLVDAIGLAVAKQRETLDKAMKDRT